VSISCSIHAETLQQLGDILTDDRKGMAWGSLFQTIVILSRRSGPGTLEQIWHLGKIRWQKP
jgi:hypothetical protein